MFSAAMLPTGPRLRSAFAAETHHQRYEHEQEAADGDAQEEEALHKTVAILLRGKQVGPGVVDAEVLFEDDR